MGKKNSESKQQPQKEKQPEEEIEGKFLLGKPKFKKLENGRYKCVETGHELPADARDSYAHTKHCRLGLIDSALARNKPPLNMFRQDPLSRSRLICKLTGHTVNKIEEHIWKHINGKRFLNMLEKEEAEAGKEASDVLIEDKGEQKPEKASEGKEDGLKKKKKKKKKNKKEEEKDVSKIISEVRNPKENSSDTEEEEFWMPPVGERWDFDDGKDRWASDSDEDVDPDNDDAIEEDATGEESNDTQELSKRTKRMSIEIGPSDSMSKQKKKKIKSTHDTTPEERRTRIGKDLLVELEAFGPSDNIATILVILCFLLYWDWVAWMSMVWIYNKLVGILWHVSYKTCFD